MSVPAVRFRTPLSAGFSEKYHVSPLSIFRRCFDVVFLGKSLHPQMIHLTGECLVGERCTKTSMRRNGCRHVCFSWS